MKKSITSVIFATFLMLLLCGSTFAAAQLSDGEYTVSIKGLEVDSDATHLRAADLVNPAKLVVKSNTIEVYFSSLGRELTFQNSSGKFDNKTVSTVEKADGEIRSDGMNLSTVRNYKVNISSLDDELIVKFPAGGSPTGALTYRIVFDSASLKQVSSAAATPAQTIAPQATATAKPSATATAAQATAAPKPSASASQNAAAPEAGAPQAAATAKPSATESIAASPNATQAAAATTKPDASENPATSEPSAVEVAATTGPGITEDEAASESIAGEAVDEAVVESSTEEQATDTLAANGEAAEANTVEADTASDTALSAPNTSSGKTIAVIILVVVVIAAVGAAVVIKKKRGAGKK